MLNVILVLDGCDPDYLNAGCTPNLDTFLSCASGWRGTLKAVMPTVTNVNNASLITGSYPEKHGITANYYRDPDSGQKVYMESADYLEVPTVFERLARQGGRTAFLTAKKKLAELLGRGASFTVTVEEPPPWLIARLGVPPSLYSVEANFWLLDAARELIRSEPGLDFLYICSTDFAMHRYAPTHSEADRHLSGIDQRIGCLLEEFGRIRLVLTADHGMSAKRAAMDLERVLAEAGIEAEVIPIIKDRHVIHHRNMGGSTYMFLRDPALLSETVACLAACDGVEAVLSREEAATCFHLRRERIGDLMVLAEADTVFGTLPTDRTSIRLRSHGSCHEQTVPFLLSWNPASNHLPLAHPEIVPWLLNQ